MRVLILSTFFIAAATAAVPVRDGCSEDASILASVQENDPIQVLHGMVGESIPCYAVSVTQGGAEVRGYVLSSTLPAILEFEKKRELESRVPIPAPPVTSDNDVKTTAAPLKPVGPPFEAWSGFTTEGKRMQIAPGAAKVTLVTFWSAPNGAARRYVEKLNKTEFEFRAKGLKSYGFIEGVDTQRANYYMEDLGLDAPQALDRQKLASKYSADPSKGTTLVIDPSNNVVAISSNPAEIRAAVMSLLSLK
jgi:hypothetical protein